MHKHSRLEWYTPEGHLRTQPLASLEPFVSSVSQSPVISALRNVWLPSISILSNALCSGACPVIGMAVASDGAIHLGWFLLELAAGNNTSDFIFGLLVR